jgi:hypothetical protein
VTVFGLAKSRPKGAGLPCCTFVALALLEAEGHTIDAVEDGPRAGGLAWWRKANVWDGDEPWSALTAARELTGAPDVRMLQVSTAAPPLRAGRWHVVQRWRRLADGGEPGVADDVVDPGRSTGHTYLAYLDHDGETCRIVQSSIAKGYRDTVGTWQGDAGLAGYSVGVVYLAPGWVWRG